MDCPFGGRACCFSFILFLYLVIWYFITTLVKESRWVLVALGGAGNGCGVSWLPQVAPGMAAECDWSCDSCTNIRPLGLIALLV